MSTDERKHFYDVISDFDNAMLVTGHGRTMHGRPMAVAEVQANGDTFFATAIDSPKIAEIEADPNVLVTFQAGSQFAVIGGTARVVRDRARIEKLWSEAWRIWFPRGKDDPSLCLLAVSARNGEYWDNSGMKGFKYMLEGAKAYFSGTRAETDDVHQHAKVDLRA
jgi:general stress protein 26